MTMKSGLSKAQVAGRAGRCAGLLMVLLYNCLAGAQLFQQPAVAVTVDDSVNKPVWATAFQHGDLDGDGKQDLLYYYAGQGPSQGTLDYRALFGNGNGTFATVPNAGEAFNGEGLVGCIAGYNAAGRQAAITITSSAGFMPPAGYVTVVPYTASRLPDFNAMRGNYFETGSAKPALFSGLTAVDLNGDGVPDLVAEDSANSVISVLLNDGAGAYRLTASYTLPAGSGMGPIATGDFNQDGVNDFAMLDTNSHVVLVFYSSGGRTSPPVDKAISISGGVYSILSATVQNGSTIVGGTGLDLLVEGASGALSVFFGSSAGLASAAVPIAGAQNGVLGKGGHLVGVADMNGDGVLNIVTATPVGIGVLLGHAPLMNHLPHAPELLACRHLRCGSGASFVCGGGLQWRWPAGCGCRWA